VREVIVDIEGHVSRLTEKLEDFSLAAADLGQTADEDISQKVFIVHGQDPLAKTELSNLTLQLGLIPIILHEQPNSGRTLIEKLEHNSSVGLPLFS
jgi:predicted nucleotide-binding protein